MTVNVKAGDRIRMVHMPDDPDPILAGTEGTVRSTTDLKFTGEREQLQVCVNWDNGRSLACLCPPDQFTIISRA